MLDVTRTPPPSPSPAGEHILTVLWDPARSGGDTEPDPAAEKTLMRLGGLGRVRVLLRAREAADVAAGEAAQRAGLPVHAILDEGVGLPAWGAERTVVLPRTQEGSEEADALALALSDAVLVLPGRAPGALVEQAQQLGKDVVGPETGPAWPPLGAGTLDYGMDPDTGWRRWAVRWVGRTEKALIELCALRPQAGKANPGGRSYERSRAKIRACFAWERTVESYFAPDGESGWRALCPDQAQAPQAALVRTYDRFDRRATFGASGHRDVIWLGHLLAAAAVFAAVAGSVHAAGSAHAEDAHARLTSLGWAGVELLLLGVVGLLTFRVVRGRVQARWMTYRFAAEQLRIVRMCLPVLVVPPVLATPDREPPSTGPGGEEDEPTVVAEMDEAVRFTKRIVRDHGLPALAAPPQAGPAGAWLRLIVADQAAYHRLNAETLETAEHRLHTAAGATFFFAFGAVVLHVAEEAHLVAEGGERTLQAATSVVLGVIGAALLLWPRGHGHGGHGGPGERRTAAETALRLGFAVAGAGLLLVLARHEALLLATAAGPALAAALHGVVNRLSLAHRAAESRAVLKGLRGVLARLPAAGGEGSTAALVRVRALAQDAARAMDTENQRWHGVLSRQSDALP